MRFFPILALTTMLSVPALAQDVTGPVSSDTPVAETPAAASAEDNRLALATRMHEIWPVSARVEDAITVVSENVPETEREAFKAKMRKAIDQKTLEQESIRAMAQVFTEPELQAMVDFYGSPEGRSVSAKTEDYMAILQPVMVKMLDSALLEMRTGTPLQSSPPSAP